MVARVGEAQAAWENERQRAWVNPDRTLVVKSFVPCDAPEHRPHNGYFIINTLPATNAWLSRG